MLHLDCLPAEQGFLGDENRHLSGLDSARAVVVPCPLEASVCYGAGTSRGPQAILEASHQVETWDEELGVDLGGAGIATLEALEVHGSIPEVQERLARTVGSLLDRGAFPLVLGGEHSLTPGAVRAVSQRFPGLMVLQVDAHADLRESYQGNANSHACSMRRCLDDPSLRVVGVGIRSMSAAEARFAAQNPERVRHFLARGRSWTAREVLATISSPVYLSLDLDGLDCSLLPATGTPEPGGLFWEETLDLLRALFRERKVVAADLVELAPIPGQPASDYLAARLATKILAYALHSA
ncbi:MAG: agmatinase [Candidatus Xenobium sp.]|jgi:agmatinase|nr:agmatinase [Burkholderiales bacterium]